MESVELWAHHGFAPTDPLAVFPRRAKKGHTFVQEDDETQNEEVRRTIKGNVGV